MPQTTQNLSTRWNVNVDSPPISSRHYLGNRKKAKRVIINGTNLGPQPPVLLYFDVNDARTDEVAPQQAIIGGTMSGTTNIATAWGRNGITHRQGGTTEGTNVATQMSWSTGTPFRNFNVGFDMAIPEGRHFNSAANPGEIPSPAASALKQVWLFDGPPDDPTKADIVVGTWTTASFQMLGNQSSLNMNHTSNVDFTGWNYFQGMSIAGADPFVNPGYSRTLAANANINTVTSVNTTTPSFGGGAANAQYSHITFFGWSGSNNGNSLAMALHAMSHLYVAGANDDSVKACIELTDNAVYANSKRTRFFYAPNVVWNSTLIDFTIPWHLLDQGFTHYRVTTQTGQVFNGAL